MWQVDVIETREGRIARAGRDEGAWPADFDAPVQAHSARLVRSLTLITLDTGLAEDAAQEALVSAGLGWGGALPRRCSCDETNAKDVGMRVCRGASIPGPGSATIGLQIGTCSSKNPGLNRGHLPGRGSSRSGVGRVLPAAGRGDCAVSEHHSPQWGRE